MYAGGSINIRGSTDHIIQNFLFYTYTAHPKNQLCSLYIAVLYSRFLGVPDWKKKLMLKKEAELSRLQQVEAERLREKREEEEKFKSMPDWKKKLVSKKRADVRF